ncbi:MAG: GNAT family N-acetyltransferase [Nitriliruptorales bacterium]|nr:GNAT family N-acetyltransferase [Nitriliruptorales bacterium]
MPVLAFSSSTSVHWSPSEFVEDVALLRHWYVDPASQRRGVGARLREHLEQQVAGVGRIIAGTYAGNYKARRALSQGGYKLSADSGAVLRSYYDIPEDRLSSSVTYERAVTPHERDEDEAVMAEPNETVQAAREAYEAL